MHQTPEYTVSTFHFESTFVTRVKLERIRPLACTGQLDSIKNRVTAWKLFLGLFPEEASPQDWLRTAQELRRNYADLLGQFNAVHHRAESLIQADPLSPHPEVSVQAEPLASHCTEQ